jgi:cytidine deaminase
MEITPETKERLIDEAKQALQNTYPNDALYRYAAAVLTQHGNIYSAANYCSPTQSLTLHGEQCALVHARAHGEETIVAIATASNEDLKEGEFTAPCHMCKQLLWESRIQSQMPLLIILSNSFGQTQEVYIDELMPLPWPAKK